MSGRNRRGRRYAPTCHSSGGHGDAVFQRAEMWPVRLRLPAKSGITVWGPIGDDDKLLAAGGLVMLFRGEEALRRFLQTDPTHSLVASGGYQSFRTWAVEASGWSSGSFNADCVWVRTQLRRPRWDRWSLSTSLQILSSLNTLWDVGITAEDDSINDRMAPDRPLGRLMDLLDVFDVARNAELAGFDHQSVESEYEVVLKAADKRSIVVC